ncbi:MAG TPA: chromosome segregation protein SMC [Methanomicrobiales archaeon]|nr:chromosome segregation protein SMC [Methanomicrobiales archaeon]
MHITQIEIDNFKSFGRKTTIPFFEHFTVISGPNGSGKSNIIDAILFSLALSSSRTLRAEKLTDLINLNSGKNTAEVAITFSDNTTIRRRIRRTPHGYYSYNYLNNRLCKQTDITEFLAKVGIKPEGYNVVMQGDITRIMEMSDTERRRILDEIAGVAEFDSKKDAALRELEVVRERIDREELMLHELDTRLSELEAERDRAVEYRVLLDKIHHFEGCRSAAELREKEKELLTLREAAGDQGKALEKAKGALADIAGTIEKLNGEVAELDGKINEKSGPEYLGLVSTLEAEKGKITLAEQTIERLGKEKEGNLEEINRIYLDQKRAETKVTECTQSVRTLSIDRANLAMEAGTLKGKFDVMDRDVKSRTANAESSRDRLFGLMEEVEKKKAARAEVIHKKDLIIEKTRGRSSERERLQREVEAAEAEMAEKDRQVAECGTSTADREAEKQGLDRELAAAEGKLFALRAESQRLETEGRAKERELARLEAQQQGSGEGTERGLEVVKGLDGVHGTIRELGKADQEYAVALSVAAGGRIRNIVVDNDRVAADAITLLKEQKLGRFTFLPLKNLKQVNLPPLEARPGVIDYAVNLIKYDPVYAPAFRIVFGRTVVMDTLDRARKLLGKYRMVTLEGELLEESGAMTGGSLKKVKGFGIAADDDIARLRADLQGLAIEAEEVKQAIAKGEEVTGALRGRRTTLDEEMARFRILAEEYGKRRDALTEERAVAAAGVRKIDEETGGGGQELAACEVELDGMTGEINRVAAEVEELKKTLDDDALPGIVAEMERLRTETDEVEKRLRNKDGEIAGVQQERSYFTKRVEELTADKDRVAAKNKEIEGTVAASKEEIATAKETIVSLDARLSSFSSELADLRSARDSLTEKVRTVERKRVDREAAIEKVTLQISALVEKETALTAALEGLRVQAAGIETELSLKEIEDGLAEAKKGVEGMGAVNMLAIEEYERTTARAKERKERKEVLSKERASILERIEQYEKMKFSAFQTAFTAIDGNFREIFARLTRGSGHLVLENEEDPFAGGLTFAVQPRDKKVHLLSALSGGEKSLTTLAFIFSIQKYLPAPFYALDEVDMFLDGYNVEQIANMIRELAANAQFVIVSLRKPMIDCADRIVGVTLREDKSTLVTGVKASG